VGRSQLQDHDGDDDGDHAVAEGFESGFMHSLLLISNKLVPVDLQS
jgi:hypothetical protein